MERKLERCIRLRFVSLCTCVCTRECVYEYVWAICLFRWQRKEYQQNIDQPLKIINVVFVFNTSLGAFARWKAPSIPRCGRRRWRRENVKNATAVAAMVAAFTARRAFAAFVLCFCFRSVCVLLASWWYKLSMRLLNFFFAVPENFPNQNKGKPKCFGIGAHSVTIELSLCACFEPNSVVFPGFTIFPSQFSPSAECVCVEFPRFFAEIVRRSPRFPYIGLTFELCLCIGFDFNVCQISSPSLPASWHFASLTRAGARFFPVPRGKVRYVRAPLQPILSMMSPIWGVCLLVDFSRLSKNRLNPKRAHSCLAAVFGNFWTCSTLFCFGVIFSKKWNSFWHFVWVAKEIIFGSLTFRALFRAWCFEG